MEYSDTHGELLYTLVVATETFCFTMCERFHTKCSLIPCSSYTDSL